MGCEGLGCTLALVTGSQDRQGQAGLPCEGDAHEYSKWSAGGGLPGPPFQRDLSCILCLCSIRAPREPQAVSPSGTLQKPLSQV